MYHSAVNLLIFTKKNGRFRIFFIETAVFRYLSYIYPHFEVPQEVHIRHPS